MRILALAVSLLLTGPAFAQSPYAGMQARPIKAPSDQQIADLQAGRGMGLALPAELNGYPGPSHLLELSDKLESIMIDSGLFENGQPIRLQVVIFKPEGAGPFPLLVVNHGSTGKGTDPELFKVVVVDPKFARIFVDKGYLVAFPQRRGRGKSDGLYDEGFYSDRTLGYTCEPARALAGADRALVDIEAAVAALRRRPDVKDKRMLMAGSSRGGALSIAYAGVHPYDIAGVINFVGGWITEDCGLAARQINSTLLARGAAFQRSTLWLYGLHDRFYSLGHSGENFAAFRSAGGKGIFLPFDVGGDGHQVIAASRLWTPDVNRYLDEIDSSGGK